MNRTHFPILLAGVQVSIFLQAGEQKKQRQVHSWLGSQKTWLPQPKRCSFEGIMLFESLAPGASLKAQASSKKEEESAERRA